MAMGKIPEPHLFKNTDQSNPRYKVWPSKGEGTENAKACDRTHAAPPQASAAQKTNSTESCYVNGLGVHYLIRKPKKPYGNNWERIPQPM